MSGTETFFVHSNFLFWTWILLSAEVSLLNLRIYYNVRKLLLAEISFYLFRIKLI